LGSVAPSSTKPSWSTAHFTPASGRPVSCTICRFAGGALTAVVAKRPVGVEGAGAATSSSADERRSTSVSLRIRPSGPYSVCASMSSPRMCVLAMRPSPSARTSTTSPSRNISIGIAE
jgi:hypothetical protein